ncbi:MAG: aminotransferase class V-fold PLP-dependent enzyme [Sphingomonadaceae bacterium]|nr:aminotransferase class V-fold PLP-dependent enzyme [Sphingomonadaceae bacterium]
MALHGPAAPVRTKASTHRRILTSAVDHKCTLEAARRVARQGIGHEIIPGGSAGIVGLTALEVMLDEHVLLVAVVAANNEVGTSLGVVPTLCARHGVLFDIDAAQAQGQVPLSRNNLRG